MGKCHLNGQKYVKRLDWFKSSINKSIGFSLYRFLKMCRSLKICISMFSMPIKKYYIHLSLNFIGPRASPWLISIL